MGRDKALLPYHGIALAKTVADIVGNATETVSLVGDHRRHAYLGHTVVSDVYPGQGPLGGILTALQQTWADWNLIVACDMPDLKVEFLRRLLAAAESCECDALVPAGPSGRLEPLCAVYHHRSLGGLYAAFSGGVRKISAALTEIRAITWPVPEVSCFQNVNTPEDWAPYER
jgi:molybdopterin-guanine dinucleotide biosynthesis protein A